MDVSIHITRSRDLLPCVRGVSQKGEKKKTAKKKSQSRRESPSRVLLFSEWRIQVVGVEEYMREAI